MKIHRAYPLLLCLITPQAFAIDAGSVISNAVTAHDTAVNALQGAKALRARDFSIAAGNRAIREVLAQRANAAVKYIQDTSKKYGGPLLSGIVQFSDSGATILGAAYEGDGAGAGAEIVQAGVSNLTVAGGAAAGGKLFAAAGAMVGSSVPVVGTAAGALVGGVVGSIGGAVVTSMGYDAYLKDWVKATAEGALTREIDPVEQARQARAEFLLKQQQEAAIRKGEQEKAQAAKEFGYDIPAGSSDDREVQFATKLPDIQLPDQAASDPGKGIPLIPSNATIETTVWINPEFSAKETYFIKEGQVSGHFKGAVPIATGYTSGTREGTFQGRITDNKITGSWLNNYRYGLTGGNCTGPLLSEDHIETELTLNIDGSLAGKVNGGSMKVRIVGCPGGDVTRTDKIPGDTVEGRWHLVD